MQELINDLLTYSRVGTRALRARGRRCQPQLVDQVIGDLAAAIDESGGRVTRDDLPTVLGDRDAAAPALPESDRQRASSSAATQPPRCTSRPVADDAGVDASRCATMASASSRSTSSASSSCSSACTRAPSTRAPASAWRSARRSSSGTADESGANRRRAGHHVLLHHCLTGGAPMTRPSGRPIEILLVEDNPGDVRLDHRGAAREQGPQQPERRARRRRGARVPAPRRHLRRRRRGPT